MKKISKIVFIICILCWIIYFSLGIKAAFTGCYRVNLGWSMEISPDRAKMYGVDAFKETLFVFGIAGTVIPILPISLLYIIIYLIIKVVRRINLKKNMMNT